MLFFNTEFTGPFGDGWHIDNTIVVSNASRVVIKDSVEGKTVEDLGFLIGLPQIPPWMCSHLADLVDAQASGGPELSKYTVEWFERVIYLDEATAKTIEAENNREMADRIKGIVGANLLLQTPFSVGCAKSAPLVEVARWTANGLETLAGRFHAYIEDFLDPATSIKVKTLSLIPVDESKLAASLNTFVASRKHAQLKALHVTDNPVMLNRKRRQLRAIFYSSIS